MDDKKYPVGTKIRFIHKSFDTGLTGTIVGFLLRNRPAIFLPLAEKHIRDGRYPTLPDGTKFTWHCRWDEIEPLIKKNQQLLFSFMGKDA